MSLCSVDSPPPRRRSSSALARSPRAATATTDAEPTTGPVKLRFLSLAWQKESLQANKDLVAKWNAEHPDIQVEYVQGDWNSVHDQLLTSFEGGDAPDIFQYEAAVDRRVQQAGLPGRPVRPDLPATSRVEISPGRLGHRHLRRQGRRRAVPAGVAGRHRQQEAARRRRRRGAAGRRRLDLGRVPGQRPEAHQAGDTYGVAWALKSPTNRVMNLSLNFDGKFFYTEGGKTDVQDRRRREGGPAAHPRHDLHVEDGLAGRRWA